MDWPLWIFMTWLMVAQNIFILVMILEKETVEWGFLLMGIYIFDYLFNFYSLY